MTADDAEHKVVDSSRAWRKIPPPAREVGTFRMFILWQHRWQVDYKGKLKHQHQSRSFMIIVHPLNILWQINTNILAMLTSSVLLACFHFVILLQSAMLFIDPS